MDISDEERVTQTAYAAAKYCKYLLQFTKHNIEFPLSLENVPAKMFYAKYANEFKKLARVFIKNNLDIQKYLVFYINVQCKREKDIKNGVITQELLHAYIDELKTDEKYKRIYEWFIKSVKNIALDATNLDFRNVKDYLTYLIDENKLAACYVSGRISKYYFAAIPGFDTLVKNLDHFAQDDFRDLVKNYDVYHNEICSAMIRKHNVLQNPFKITNECIDKLRGKKPDRD